MSQTLTVSSYSGNTNKVGRVPDILDDDEIEVRVRIARMTSFSAPESRMEQASEQREN
jgi:hypothetical protein